MKITVFLMMCVFQARDGGPQERKPRTGARKPLPGLAPSKKFEFEIPEAFAVGMHHADVNPGAYVVPDAQTLEPSFNSFINSALILVNDADLLYTVVDKAFLHFKTADIFRWKGVAEFHKISFDDAVDFFHEVLELLQVFDFFNFEFLLYPLDLYHGHGSHGCSIYSVRLLNAAFLKTMVEPHGSSLL
jgi:hypothetical protein